MKEENPKKIKRQRTLFGSAIVGLLYLMVSSNYGTPNILKWGEIEKERIQKEQNKINYEIKVDSVYDNLLKTIPTFSDSLNFYLKYNLPIRFNEPSLEQKEEVLRQNNLEKDLI